MSIIQLRVTTQQTDRPDPLTIERRPSELKHLGLMFPENFKDPSDTSPPLPFNLSSLALWLDDGNGADVTSIEGTSPHFLRALCTSSLSNLSKLNLRVCNPKSGALFFPSLALLGPRLRTLVLSATGEAFKSHFHLFKTPESLKRLELDLVWSEDDEPEGFEFLGAVLDALPSPPTLLHLRIKLHKIPRDKSLEMVSENRALGLLVRLELWGFDEKASLGKKQEARLKAARSVLAERGATIVLGGI